jgi:hypothetical protein
LIKIKFTSRVLHYHLSSSSSAVTAGCECVKERGREEGKGRRKGEGERKRERL